jgi:hypothetical protein
MREKRVWPPVSREVDAAESVAQFEATVAVAKQTVAKSGEMLVSVKEDLSDHQRWLQMQAAAAEADRVRHERWLRRQHERRQAEARREETRERRRAFRRRIFGRIEYAGLSVLIAIVGAWTSVTDAVKGGFRFVTGSIGAGLGWIGSGIDSGLGAIGRQARLGAQWSAATVRHAAQWSTATVRQAAGATGEASALAFNRLGTGAGRFVSTTVEKTKDAGARVSAKLRETAPVVGTGLSAGYAGIAARVSDASAAAQRSLRSISSKLSAKVQETAPMLGGQFATVSAGLGARAAEVSGSARQMLGAGLAAASAKLRSAAPPLQAAMEGVSAKARGLAGSALAQTQGLLDRVKPTEQPEATSETQGEQPSEAIDWLFDDAARPLPERSVFTVEEVPGGLRLEGFSFTGQNRLDLPLTDVSASIKPDLKLTDLKLALHVAEPDETEDAPRTGGTVVPPRGLFRLAAAFPPEAMDEEAGELVASYGGLTLKLRYRVGEEERSLTRFIAPALLNAQLAEIPESDEPPIARF